MNGKNIRTGAINIQTQECIPKRLLMNSDIPIGNDAYALCNMHE